MSNSVLPYACDRLSRHQCGATCNAGARNKLSGEIRAKVDGIATAPDWMNAWQRKDHVRSEVDLIVSLLSDL